MATSACQNAFQFHKPDCLSRKLTSLKWTTAGTPYEDGTFRMKMILGPDFPNTPPKGTLTHFLCMKTILSSTWSNQNNTGACLQSALSSAHSISMSCVRTLALCLSLLRYFCGVASLSLLHMQHATSLLSSEHTVAKTCLCLYVMYVCDPKLPCRLLLDQDFPPQCI